MYVESGGVTNAAQKTNQTQPAGSLLLYSPTFNTLDNRFEELNTGDSRVNIGGLGANGSREQDINGNIFTNSTWPGF